MACGAGCDTRELLLRVRALEIRGFVAGCGCLGYDANEGVDYAGRGMVCDPEGRVVADAGGAGVAGAMGDGLGL